MKQPIKICLVDDHDIFRTGLEYVINSISDCLVIGSFPDAEQLLSFMENKIPDLLFTDIKMPGKSGIILTESIKVCFPNVRIIALTMFSEIEYFNKMIDAGADGFLLKSTDIRELEKAIFEVMAGSTYFAKEYLSYINMKQKTIVSEHSPVTLSERELEVLRLICNGFSNNEIAEELFISPHTVDGHRRSLITKTGVKNAPNLVLYAIKYGLVDLK